MDIIYWNIYLGIINTRIYNLRYQIIHDILIYFINIWFIYPMIILFGNLYHIIL